MNQKPSRTIPVLIIASILLSLGVIAGIFAFISTWHSNLPEPNSEETASIPGESAPYNFNYSWTDQGPYIAHALGGILGSDYTNSYEAFLLNYQLGRRLFEVDFALTTDGEVVLMHTEHEWQHRIRSSDQLEFTSNNFLSSLYDGKFHTMNYQQLIDLMIEYPDFYLITDSKYTDEARINQEFSQIIEYAKSQDPSVLDRFVVQIYHPAMLETVMKLYPWKSIIYTLYQDPNWTPENVVQFAKQSGVQVIAIYTEEITPEIGQLWANAGLTIASFTSNNLNQVDRLRQDCQVKIFYTDFLLP